MSRKLNKINLTELKSLARGRWLEIFAAVAGVRLEDDCQRRHGPCPMCGGVDRFRAIDLDKGALYCNQCFATKNGDGIAALGWLTGRPFTEVVDLLCEFLGETPRHKRNGKPYKPKTFATPQGIVKYYQETLSKKCAGKVRLTGSWRYETFTVLRFDLPTPAGEKQLKEFRPVHQVPLGTGGSQGWQYGYPSGPRPLYRLADLEAAPPDLITIHGGEKAADAAHALGIPATTNAGGEKAIEHTDWTPVLRFAVIAIVTDNDPAGEAFGQLLAAKIRGLKPGADIRIVRLPDLPAKGDIVEWIAAGGTRNRLMEFVAGTATHTPAQLDPEESDDDPHRLARVFLRDHSPWERIVHWRGEYWSWDTYYRQMHEADLRAEITKAVKAEFNRINSEAQMLAAVKGGDAGDPPKTRKVTTRLVSDVVQAVRSMVNLSSQIDQQTWLDGTERPNCVILRNCILDLDAFLEPRDDWNLPHTPNWFSQIHLPYPIDLECKSLETPKWDRFLNRVMEGDPDGIKTLQEWAGYCLTHDNSLQKFLILEGEGQNGKSVFCAALIALLGRQNVSSVPLERFGDRFSLATTLGKLANIVTESTEMDDAAEGLLKSFTSGDPMQFERKHKDPFMAIPTARFTMSTNNRPRFKDGSGGLWRRMLIVRFDQTIAESERVLGMDNPAWWEASGELPGIFWWAVLGLHRLRQQFAFTESVKSREAVIEYRTETNPARAFLLETCEPEENGITYSQELYEAYTKWCKSRGYYPYAEQKFGREIRRVYPEVERLRASTSGRPRYYRGLTFVDQEVDAENLKF